eukprot:NODE_18166_length_907_cov_1.921795.p2 GENE.NODE_18166_length_907_cov_1.921795~~NODE_18166_length_907_cov_1.921795.p2  ORF type:complete len:60 (-),score=2.48 NODE_18166_length_907_cov_1.921795:470-649(-)
MKVSINKNKMIQKNMLTKPMQSTLQGKKTKTRTLSFQNYLRKLKTKTPFQMNLLTSLIT